MAKSAHFIGIGGTGLSAIARLLLEGGWQVSGSDRLLSPLAQALQQAGARVMIGHAAENIRGADVVIRSSAVSDDNPEVLAARAAGIPVLKRAEFLGELLQNTQGIAIAGSHGKTTTTAMVAWMLTALGQDPSYIIGGVSLDLGTNARLGHGAAFVVEADEYDRMFLGLHPHLAVVTNVEHDHPDCYPTPEEFYQAFLQFTRTIQPGGVLLVCVDDPGAARLADEAARDGLRVLRYGVQAQACDYRAQALESHPAGYAFTVNYQGDDLAALALQVPGLHNVRNALAAAAVAHQCSLDLHAAALAVGQFHGAGRRFEICGVSGGVTVINDYGHHPTEIQATLQAARQRFPGQTLWAVWQPHTYSRTQMLFQAFAHAFSQADHVLVTEVYASRETSAVGTFSARQVVQAMPAADAHFTPALQDATAYLLEHVQAGDVVIVFSAGDADQVSAQLLAHLSQPGAERPESSEEVG
ncbi:MAG: UDP-N-acetylmuramate--L-alanine ligase [Anaerolineales bacterium]|nr:UDP-N-acetylmuramate--L-alanine ligase [Anaerolineales bacterium]